MLDLENRKRGRRGERRTCFLLIDFTWVASYNSSKSGSTARSRGSESEEVLGLELVLDLVPHKQETRADNSLRGHCHKFDCTYCGRS